MYTASIQGIRQNFDLMNKYARNLQDFENADVAEDMVGMMIAEKAVSANLTAINTVSRMSQSVIDILA
jgi:flagellar basal body rod protein FlgC